MDAISHYRPSTHAIIEYPARYAEIIPRPSSAQLTQDAAERTREGEREGEKTRRAWQSFALFAKRSLPVGRYHVGRDIYVPRPGSARGVRDEYTSDRECLFPSVLLHPRKFEGFPQPVTSRHIARGRDRDKNDGNIFPPCVPRAPPPIFLWPRHKCRAALSHSSRYICLLVLNRPVITALKGRYSGRWLRTFYSATSRPRYLPLRSVALIARWREIAGFEASERALGRRCTRAKNADSARLVRTTRSAVGPLRLSSSS